MCQSIPTFLWGLCTFLTHIHKNRKEEEQGQINAAIPNFYPSLHGARYYEIVKNKPTQRKPNCCHTHAYIVKVRYLNQETDRGRGKRTLLLGEAASNPTVHISCW
jgi:hypothetical protein